MDRFWGGPGWREAIYDEEVQLGMFGNDAQYKIQKTTARRIGVLYKARPGDAGFAFVSEPALVLNDTGQPIYCLAFAGPNRAGLQIADNILSGMGTYLNALS